MAEEFTGEIINMGLRWKKDSLKLLCNDQVADRSLVADVVLPTAGGNQVVEVTDELISLGFSSTKMAVQNVP